MHRAGGRGWHPRIGSAAFPLIFMILIVAGVSNLDIDTAEASSTTTTTVSTTTTTAATTTTTNGRRPIEDPFNSRSPARYLRTRTDDVTAALYNVRTGETYLYHAGVRQVTASMVKIEILANLLYLEQEKGAPMSKRDVTLATSMIEESDDKAAQKLWLQIGQLPTSSAFNTLIGSKQTIPNWGWGDTETTPLDQLNLLKMILFPNAILDPTSQAFEQNLMENVNSAQRFGIPTAGPAGATVGVKNGWFPRNRDRVATQHRGLRAPRSLLLPRRDHDRPQP